MTKLILLFYLLFSLNQCLSQQVEFPYVIGARYHTGFLAAHTPPIRYLNGGPVQAFELMYARQHFGEEAWHLNHAYPQVGFSYLHFTFHKDLYQQSAHSIIAHFYKSKAKKNFATGYRIGLGLGYIKNPFNYLENYKNVAIGSHLNAAINLQYEARLKFKEKHLASLALALSHFSNGAYKVPNLGLNIPTISIGYHYLPGEKKQYLSPVAELQEKSWKRSITVAAGIKEIYPVEGRKFVAASAIFDLLKVSGPGNSAGGGIDFFLDNSLAEKLRRDTLESGNFTHKFSVGIHLSYQLNINKLKVVANAGFYPYNPVKKDGLYFQRIGLRYFFREDLFFNTTLKVHFAKADNLEWGLGYFF